MNPGAESFTVCLRRADTSQPWGFRMQGGTDFNIPLSVQSVNPGSVAESYGIKAGDAVLQINNKSSDELDHEEAKRLILVAGLEVTLILQRGAMTVWRPQVTPLGDLRQGAPQPLYEGDDPYIQKTSLAANPQESLNIGSSHNRSARPFPGFGGGQQASFQPPPPQQPGPGPVHAQYNSPMNVYSGDNVANAYQQQTQGVNSGMEGPGGNYGPVSAGSGGVSKPTGMRSVRAPVAKPPSERQPASHMTCKMCGSLITGVFVKIKGDPMHPECFKCFSCGNNLKNKGHFTVNGQLYCETCTS